MERDGRDTQTVGKTIMKLRLIFLASMCTVVSGLLFWRNSARYPTKSVIWRAIKSIIELGLILLTAIRLPVMLVSWTCLWLTRPVDQPWLKITLGVIFGVTLGFVSAYFLELLIILGIFSVDEITGDKQGFLSNLAKARKNS
jgi:hypothetical protein